jgi:SAM-dependent methyltransferase
MYTNEQARAFTEEILSVGGDGLLQFWRLSEDPLVHVEELIKGVVPYSKGFRVLDAGCGTGTFLHLLSLLRPDTVRYGVNLFESQLPKYPAETRFYVHDIQDEKEWFVNDLDLVTCMYTLGHVNVEVVMRNLSKILTQGGRLLVWDIAPKTTQVNEIFGYNLHHPIFMRDYAYRAGMKVKEYSIYKEESVSLPKWLSGMMSEKQIDMVRRYTVPVRYVFEKEK